VNELNILESLELTHNSKLDRVRDLFLVGCWTGLRFADFSNFKSENIEKDEHGEFIEVETQKTGKTVVVPILPTVQRIVAKYEGKLPKAISNQKMNDYLKEIGQLAGFDSIESKTLTKQGRKVMINKTKSDLMTTHTARRSFASNNYLAGMPTISIMAITGHSTERSFMRYIKLTPREHANKIREGWNNLSKLQQPTNNILKLVV
jgi:integrase